MNRKRDLRRLYKVARASYKQAEYLSSLLGYRVSPQFVRDMWRKYPWLIDHWVRKWG